MEIQNQPDYLYLGNQELLKLYKIGFLCSRKVPASIILKTYDWAIEQRKKGICVVSGFHSKIEKDVFNFLVKGEQPIIVVLARGMYKQIPKELLAPLKQNRLLIISLFPDNIKRVSTQTAIIRNKVIFKISAKMYIPYIQPNGIIAKLQKSIKKFGIMSKEEYDKFEV